MNGLICFIDCVAGLADRFVLSESEDFEELVRSPGTQCQNDSHPLGEYRVAAERWLTVRDAPSKLAKILPAVLE